MNGAELIAAERERQVSAEGWTPEHDDDHARGELAKAAACYAIHANGGTVTKYDWPWDMEWWKPSDPARSLVKAGALIAAEIDRLHRLDNGAPCGTCNGSQAAPCSCVDCVGNFPHGQTAPCPNCQPQRQEAGR